MGGRLWVRPTALDALGQSSAFRCSHELGGRDQPGTGEDAVGAVTKSISVEAPSKPPEKDEEPSKPPEKDDLKVIEGIGPEIAGLLADNGITTFAQLAATEVSRLKSVLAAGGSRFSRAVPTSWPAQAKLAAEGRWDEFKALEAQLRGGRQV